MTVEERPAWVYQGKTIRQLIADLQSFEDQDMKVFISVDEGETKKPISLVGKFDGVCAIIYCGD